MNSEKRAGQAKHFHRRRHIHLQAILHSKRSAFTRFERRMGFKHARKRADLGVFRYEGIYGVEVNGECDYSQWKVLGAFQGVMVSDLFNAIWNANNHTAWCCRLELNYSFSDEKNDQEITPHKTIWNKQCETIHMSHTEKRKTTTTPPIR